MNLTTDSYRLRLMLACQKAQSDGFPGLAAAFAAILKAELGLANLSFK